MRRLVALCACALALTACGGLDQWEGDVRFKVVEADSLGYTLEKAEKEMPRGSLADWYRGSVAKKEFPDGIEVGDEVTCHVLQRETGKKGFGMEVLTTNCRTA